MTPRPFLFLTILLKLFLELPIRNTSQVAVAQNAEVTAECKRNKH